MVSFHEAEIAAAHTLGAVALFQESRDVGALRPSLAKPVGAGTRDISVAARRHEQPRHARALRLAEELLVAFPELLQCRLVRTERLELILQQRLNDEPVLERPDLLPDVFALVDFPPTRFRPHALDVLERLLHLLLARR